jgi:archaellum component FlaF (FlaF/FlaG flagellin family)
MLKRNKKGFGGIASTLIMFIAIISVTTGLVIAFTNYIRSTEQSLTVQNDLTSNKIKTSVTITNVYYNGTTNVVNIYLKNIGETKLHPRFFDLYINGAFVTGFNTTEPTDFSSIVTLFEPQDTVSVNKDIVLNPGTHDVMLVTEYGVGAKDSFNI